MNRSRTPQLSGRQVFPRDASNRRTGDNRGWGIAIEGFIFPCARGETGSAHQSPSTLPKKRYTVAGYRRGNPRGRDSVSARTNSQARPISRPGRRSLGKTRGPTLGNRAVRFVSFHSSFPSFLKILHAARKREKEGVSLARVTTNRLDVLGRKEEVLAWEPPSRCEKPPEGKNRGRSRGRYGSGESIWFFA